MVTSSLTMGPRLAAAVLNWRGRHVWYVLQPFAPSSDT